MATDTWRTTREEEICIYNTSYTGSHTPPITTPQHSNKGCPSSSRAERAAFPRLCDPISFLRCPAESGRARAHTHTHSLARALLGLTYDTQRSLLLPSPKPFANPKRLLLLLLQRWLGRTHCTRPHMNVTALRCVFSRAPPSRLFPPKPLKGGGGGGGEGNKLEQYIIILKKHGSASLGQRRECNANANANADANATQCNAMQFKQHQNKKNLKL